MKDIKFKTTVRTDDLTPERAYLNRIEILRYPEEKQSSAFRYQTSLAMFHQYGYGASAEEALRELRAILTNAIKDIDGILE